MDEDTPVDNAAPPTPVAGVDQFAHFIVNRTADGQLDLLGRGAMGITYRAIDTQLDRMVALKVINPQFVHETSVRSRFLREAKTAARINHPNIASILYQGVEEDTCFFVMELIQGESLHDYIWRVGTIAPIHALGLARQVALALAGAASENILHRDLKPGNIMLCSYHAASAPHVKVIDFGLAKVLGEAASFVSQPGFIGTAEFASPEQIAGEELDCRSDLYSLGICIWFMLVRDYPFSGTLLSVMNAHVNTPPDFGKLHQAPPAMLMLLSRLLAKDPKDRPQDPELAVQEIDITLEALQLDETAYNPISTSDGAAHQTSLPTAAGGSRRSGQTAPQPNSSKQAILAIGAALILLAAAGAGWGWYAARQENEALARNDTAARPPTDPVVEATPVPSPTPISSTPTATPTFATPTPTPTPAPTPTPTFTTPTPASSPLVAAASPTPVSEVTAPTPEPAPSPSAASQAVVETKLGLPFIYVEAIGGFVTVHEIRRMDFDHFVLDTNYRSPGNSGNGGRAWERPGFEQTPEDPVVNVSPSDALAYLEWLTQVGQKMDGLPQDSSYQLLNRRQWDTLTGAKEGPFNSNRSQPTRPPGNNAPTDRFQVQEPDFRQSVPPQPPGGNRQRPGPASGRTLPYLWLRPSWPPPNRIANFADRTAFQSGAVTKAIPDYDDGTAWTAPGGTFPPNRNGVTELIGNVREIVLSGPRGGSNFSALGASWKTADQDQLRMHVAESLEPSSRATDIGFRIWLKSP